MTTKRREREKNVHTQQLWIFELNINANQSISLFEIDVCEY